MSGREEHDHEKRNGRVKAAGTWFYGRWKNRGAGSKLKTLVQALVATGVAGGLTVGAIGYSQALDAKAQLVAVQNQLNAIDLGNGVISIPTPPDLTEAVQQAQGSADAAQGSADAAASSAAAALAAVPKLSVFPDATVNNLDGPWANIGTVNIAAGTYIIEAGFVASGNSQARVRFDDGRVMAISTGSGFRDNKAALSFKVATSATLEVDSLVYTPGSTTYRAPFILTTRVQGS